MSTHTTLPVSVPASDVRHPHAPRGITDNRESYARELATRGCVTRLSPTSETLGYQVRELTNSKIRYVRRREDGRVFCSCGEHGREDAQGWPSACAHVLAVNRWLTSAPAGPSIVARDGRAGERVRDVEHELRMLGNRLRAISRLCDRSETLTGSECDLVTAAAALVDRFSGQA